MSLVTYIKVERYKLASNAVVTAIGFLLALLINGLVDDWKSKGKRDSTLQAIRYEATSNEQILKTSFVPLYRNGIVFRQFNTSVISQAMTSQDFIEHSSAESIEIVQQYYRAITLANIYREKVEKISFSDEYLSRSKAASESQIDGIRQLHASILDAWEKNIQECQTSMLALKATK